MLLFFCIISSCYSQTWTTINTCANEKKVFKLDIRERLDQLQAGSTLEDIDAYALCQEAYQYDYIWLHQLWTPSQYNYKDVNGQPQQTNDYRVLENIKEYLIDPSLGSLTNLYKFQQNVKKYCLHIKFLGEFAFYVPKDSYLIQNITRFFRRPKDISPHVYSDRYDKDQFQSAMNDQMKTVPYATPWNYLTLDGFQDMLDIIYRIIITQHKLDGIVFLQPSLGLFQSVSLNYYQAEINDQADLLYMKDFYENIKLQSMATDLYFMGGDDNSQYKSKLLNYLQIIYNQPTPADNWINTNYTLLPDSYVAKIDDKSVQATISNQLDAKVDQTMSPTKNTCIRFNFTNYNNGAAGVFLAGKGLYVILSGYTQDVFYQTFGYNQGGTDPRRNASFFYGSQDILEVQFEPQKYLIRIKKLYLENNQQASLYMENEPDYTKIKFTASIYYKNVVLQIAFPFMFSQAYKHSYYTILGHRHIQLSQSDNDKFYLAQVEPSINQAENNFTLNFYNLYIKPGVQLALGVCDRERLQKNNHVSSLTNGIGAYLLFNNGQTWHNTSSNIAVGLNYDTYDLISVTYTKSNNSILYFKNKTYLYSIALVDKVKNLNFCVSMIGQYSTIYLEY